METNKRYIEEDEIDLVELFKTLLKKKWFIIIFTSIITLVAIIYAYMKTPIYEVKTLIEIGSYKIDTSTLNSTSTSDVILDKANDLSRKLNIIFIDTLKNDKDRESLITSISIPKLATNFIEIKAESISNELAINELNKVITYVQKKHALILSDIKKDREIEINNIDTQIKNIQTKDLEFLNEEIELAINNLRTYKNDRKEIVDNIKEQKKLNPTLAALSLIEKRDLNTEIRLLEKDIIELKGKKNKLLTTGINDLIEEKSRLESMLFPYNYMNSEIVGKIITNDYPIKPKKKLIVVVAFVTGFILSIFLVFFIEFIQNIKRNEE